ncbi:14933_t:CDS:2 [Rhizophagus irregularis]|nr:14933_t:CDS:2 [Rhizophagus irregularis]
MTTAHAKRYVALSTDGKLSIQIFVALSRPGKSPEVNKTEALDALEKGISNPATWIFSILNKVHNIGITKTTIPLNYHQYTNFKLNILECYDLEGSNNGELVKSFKVDSNKQYFKESSRCSYKNSVTIISLYG